MDKNSFIEIVTYFRDQFDEFLPNLPIADLSTPGIYGTWSVKDVLSHIAWYEKEMVVVLTTHDLTGSDWWDLPLDERNARIYEANRDRPAREVLAEFKQVYPQLLTALDALGPDDLNQASSFANMPGDWLPWQLIASNTFDHYPHHINAIQDWAKTKTAKS